MSDGNKLKPATQPNEQPATEPGITAAGALVIFPGAKVIGNFELIVRRPAPCPIDPVVVALDFSIFGSPDHQVRSTIPVPYVTIIDPSKFVSATLAALASFVSAKNSGCHHWIEDIVDEKIEQLRLCGVEAEIRALQ